MANRWGANTCYYFVSITDDRLWLAAGVEQRRQFPRHPCTRQRRVSNQGQAFAGAVIDHGHDPEPAAIGQLVGHEVQRPTSVRRQW